MTYLKVSFLLFFSAFMLAACSGETSDQMEAGKYSIDSTRISQPVPENDLHITFNPPLNWKLSESDLSNKLIQTGSRKFGNSDIVYKPLKLYLNISTNSTLFLGKIIGGKKFSENISVLDEYKKILRSIYSSEITAERVIKNQHLEMTEFRIRKESIYSYKLLFEDRRGNLIQLDYTTLENYLPKEQTAIESSISTIELL